MKTMVYVDAFNLYYGSLKKTPYKWLNIAKLCQELLRTENVIVGIKYFTATIQAREDDSDRTTRQQVYLRALRTLPKLQIFYGHYLSHVVTMPLAEAGETEKRFVKVIKTDEKGTDVNLASHMLVDAFENRYDCAVLISGDSDLETPVKFVKDKFKKVLGVINPQQRKCHALQTTAHFYKHIRPQALARCQFPTVLHDGNGSFNKPVAW